jgi:hypothetical protein
MIYLAILSGFTIGVILALFGYVCYQFETERNQWFGERQILLNRIENPSYRPPLSPAEKRADLEKIEQLREETEQFGLVGKIID